jgi:hypothetical protein
MPLTVRDPAFFFALLSAQMLQDPTSAYVFDQFADKEIEFNKTEGDTIVLNRYPHFGEAGLTQIARQLNETTPIGIADPVGITAQAVTIILQEYGGPYNTAVNRVVPLGITEKVARRAQQKLIDWKNPLDFFNSIGGQLLKDDQMRWHDRVLCRLYLTSPNTTNPGSKADNATLATDKISTDDLIKIKEKLMTRNVPTFSDGLYAAAICPRMEAHLKQDDKFLRAMQFGSPQRLYRGELGIYEGFRFITSNNIPTEIVNALTGHLGIFFGPHAVGYGVGMAPQIRKNKNDDYERFLYLIWLAYMGYAALDTRFIEVARTFAP